MTKLIHMYMFATKKMGIYIDGVKVTEYEMPVQDLVVFKLKSSGHWMFEDGVMKG